MPCEQKTFLFTDYYKIADHAKQKTYLMGLIQICKVDRRRHGKYENAEESRRQSTVCYTVPNGKGEHIQVCRQTFSNIFALSHKAVQVLSEKKKMGEMVYTDKRGKSNKPRKYGPLIREQIKEHIKSFPYEENHYSRNKSKKQFLSSDLNVNRLYLAFRLKFPDINATYKYYMEVFKKDFPHLRFGRPKTDTCSVCDLHNNKIKCCQNDIDKNSTKEKLELHQRKAEKARIKMEEDANMSQVPTANITMMSIDLEQVLFLPTLTHTQMFYSRQLSCYNLGIHISDTATAHMCLWDESITGRGGNEISSALLKCLTLQANSLKRNLVIWSDNCIGQNKNKMLLFLFIYLVATGKFDKIEQKFLVSGHSYLACDRDFAQIERRKRVTKNYVPDDLEKMIRSAQHKNPFNVIRMNKQDFKDFQEISDCFLNTTKLNISKVCWMEISKENPILIKTKKTFNNWEDWASCNVLKRGKTISEIKTKPLPKLNCKNRLSKEKVKNLQDMLDYIPVAYLPFYTDLIEKANQNAE